MRRELRDMARRALKRPAPRPAHWEGVYERRSDVAADGAGFASDAWIAATRTLTQQVLAGTAPTEISAETQILATLVAPRTRARILDFGGGMGISYLRLVGALGAPVELDYVVVEGERVCAEARALLGSRKGLTFATALPAATERFDIVFACSSMQYVDDDAAILSAFAAYEPSVIVLADVPAGEGRGFWTQQRTVTGSRIPYHFFATDDLVATLAPLHYKLWMRGAGRTLDIGDLGAPLRVERTCNLVFGRTP
jgi:putative methyltransferase (TIGR04325 family)